MDIGIRCWVSMCRCALPDNFVDEAPLTEYLIQHNLEVVDFFDVEMQVKASVVSEKFAQQDETAARKFQQLRAHNFILICLLVLAALKILFRRKRRIDVNQSHAGRAIRSEH